MNIVLLSLICLTLSSCADFATKLSIYPKGEKPSCLTQPKQPSKVKNPKLEKYVAASASQNYSSPYSLWDQEILKNNPHLRQALQEYAEGKRGLSVKDLMLTNKTPQLIHSELVGKGFKHKRVPLVVNPNDKAPQYWRVDGSKTNSKWGRDLIHMDTYYHKDGGLVRVKPQGIPDPKYPRSHPHAAKSVLLNTNNVSDTSWKNEAFKVSEEGHPIPKAPTKAAGLKLSLSRLQRDLVDNGEDLIANWMNAVMDKAHLDVKVDFSHCI
jgi:hypothetical protein